MTLTQDELKELLNYDPVTGIFTWNRNQGTRKKGNPAGFLVSGYTYICLKRKTYPAHRLAFLYMEGNYPTSDVDHKDMDRNNNSFENLRISTRRLNMLNTNRHKDSTTGVKNVTYRKDTGLYSVRLMVDGKYQNFGCFTDLELASAVARDARNQHHGEYARHT